MLNNGLICAFLAAAMMATASPAAVTIYTSQTAFLASHPGAASHSFPFTRSTEVDPSYTTGGVTFSAEDLLGYSDKGYGTKQSYIGAVYGDTLGVSYSGMALGLTLGSYNGAQTIGYSVGGQSGSLSLPSRTATTFIGFDTSDVGGLSIIFTQPSYAGEINVLNFQTASSVINSAVPEPASWALMLCGFGLVGGTVRSHRRSVSLA